MEIFIKVKPKAREARVIKIDEAHFNVWVKEPARDSMANEAVLEALAEWLDIAKNRLEIVSGQRGKQKTIEIL